MNIEPVNYRGFFFFFSLREEFFPCFSDKCTKIAWRHLIPVDSHSFYMAMLPLHPMLIITDNLFICYLTVRRSNQSILKEINPEYSLEGLMLKLKLQYFDHLMQRTDSLEKTLMLGKIEGGRRRG